MAVAWARYMLDTTQSCNDWLRSSNCFVTSSTMYNSLAGFAGRAWRLAKLNHNHIVPIYDLFDDDHSFWLVMELLTGGSLDERIKEQKKLGVEDSVAITNLHCPSAGIFSQQGLRSSRCQTDEYSIFRRWNTETDRFRHSQTREVELPYARGCHRRLARLPQSPSKPTEHPLIVAATFTRWAYPCIRCSPARFRSKGIQVRSWRST